MVGQTHVGDECVQFILWLPIFQPLKFSSLVTVTSPFSLHGLRILTIRMVKYPVYCPLHVVLCIPQAHLRLLLSPWVRILNPWRLKGEVTVARLENLRG